MGRAPKLPVCLPPWAAVGKRLSALQQAYGGFWTFVEPSKKAASEHEACIGAHGVSKSVRSLDAHCQSSEVPLKERTVGIKGTKELLDGGHEVEGATKVKNPSMMDSDGVGLEQCMLEIQSQCDVPPSAASVLALAQRLQGVQREFLFMGNKMGVPGDEQQHDASWLHVSFRVQGKGSCELGAALVRQGSAHGLRNDTLDSQGQGTVEPGGLGGTFGYTLLGFVTAVYTSEVHGVCGGRGFVRSSAVDDTLSSMQLVNPNAIDTLRNISVLDWCPML